MSTPPPPPAILPGVPTPTETPDATGTLVLPIASMIIAGIFTFIFALGAAYLSFKTFGSYPWALLDFFFPYIYYPYYAFVLNPATVAPPSMFGGKRTIMNLLKMKW